MERYYCGSQEYRHFADCQCRVHCSGVDYIIEQMRFGGVLMEVDVKLLLSLAAIGVSVVSASVIVKQKLATVIEQLAALSKDYEARLRSLDQRTDRQENLIELNQQKTSVLSSILSPNELEKNHRMSERILIMAETNEARISKLESLHNGKHNPT